MELSLFINTRTSDKIESQIKYLKNHKVWPWTVPLQQYFKKLEKYVPLAEFIKLFFNQGKFPAVLKIA